MFDVRLGAFINMGNDGQTIVSGLCSSGGAVHTVQSFCVPVNTSPSFRQVNIRPQHDVSQLGAKGFCMVLSWVVSAAVVLIALFKFSQCAFLASYVLHL